MKNIYAWLVEKSPQISIYGYLKDLFRPFPELILEYDWLLSDIDCNFFPKPLVQGDDAILTGKELLTLASNEDQPQFVWCVFSSLFPGEQVELSKNEIYADGNADLWNTNVRIQHESSDIEIVSFDSSLFIFLTTKTEICDKIKNTYPEGRELVQWILDAQSRRGSRVT